MAGKRKKLPALDASHYFNLLTRKLPKGWLWRMQVQPSGEVYGDGFDIPQTRFGRVMWAIADELAFAHNRVRAMFNEAIADTATETIDNHEADLGLPFAGYPAPATLVERRAICKAQDLMKGSTRNTHFETLGTTLGLNVDVNDRTDQKLAIVHMIPGSARATCNSPCNAALITFGSDAAVRYACFVHRYKPAGRSIYWKGLV